MFSSIISLFTVRVSEDPATGIITILGIPTRYLFRDIQKVWKTSLITRYAFDNIKPREFSFHKFFAPDMYYTLEGVLDYKDKYSNTRDVLKALEQLKTNTWLRSCFEEHPNILDISRVDNLLRKPLPHQLDFLKMYNDKIPKMQLDGMLLAADVGTGKTYMSLALSECLEADIVIVIAPKSIVNTVWYNGIKEEFGNLIPIFVAANKTLFPKGTVIKYYVFHYEALDQALLLAKEMKYKKPIIILDESHNLNEIKSLRTNRFLELCETMHCKNVIFASGTAIKAMGYETIPLLRAIDPYFTPVVEEKFRSIYGKNPGRAVDILRNRLNLISHKIPKSMVMRDTPPITKRLPIKIPNGEEFTIENVKHAMQKYIVERTAFYNKNMTEYVLTYSDCLAKYEATLTEKEQRAEFREYKDKVQELRDGYDARTMGPIAEWCNWYEKTKIIPVLPSELKTVFKDVKSVVKYLKLKVLGEALGNILSKKRAQCHSAMIEHSDIDKIVNGAEKKTVLFSNYVDTILVAQKYFKDKNFDVVSVYGDTNHMVSSIVDKFKTDDKVNPLIATIQSLSTGVTLIVANVVIFLNLPFREYEREQAANRIYRIGQNAQCYIYEMVLDTGNIPNLSTRLSDIMNWSREQSGAILGKDDAPVAVENLTETSILVDNDWSLEHFLDEENELRW